MVSEFDLNIKVAVMGCVVNGPGEAREADIGIAGGEGCGVLIKKGEIIKKVGEDKLYEKLDAWKAKLLKITNKNVSKASQVSSVEVMKEPFEKTATQKIRRFKYKESAPTVEEEKKTKE